MERGKLVREQRLNCLCGCLWIRGQIACVVAFILELRELHHREKAAAPAGWSFPRRVDDSLGSGMLIAWKAVLLCSCETHRRSLRLPWLPLSSFLDPGSDEPSCSLLGREQDLKGSRGERPEQSWEGRAGGSGHDSSYP